MHHNLESVTRGGVKGRIGARASWKRRFTTGRCHFAASASGDHRGSLGTQEVQTPQFQFIDKVVNVSVRGSATGPDVPEGAEDREVA